jgi:serine/threonine-protein kinase
LVEAIGPETARRAVREALAGSYALEHELGRGGTATVYLARDLRHRRQVAVKVLHPELSAVLGPERFLREIELTASLQHPHILQLFDSGAAGGLLYYVMPYVAGESLRDRMLTEGPLPLDDALRIACEVAEALAYAHARGVVHRDIKPENILLQQGHALVADFGIALAVEQAGGERMTRTGFSLGTPQYMAPEQASGQRGIDARADVYALGAVLYEMLAGEPPITGPTAQAILARVLTERPRPLATLRDTVTPHVDAAVTRALAKLPADRFPSTAAFAAALAEPSAARTRRTWRTGRARPLLARVGTLAAVAVGAAALGWAVGRTSATQAVPAAGRSPVRFAIEPDSGVVGYTTPPALSPDGHTVVYPADGPDGARLYVRRLDEVASRPLAATEGAEWPFFSPDGSWVAFYSEGALRKVRVDGGAPVVVAEMPPPPLFFGGSWGPDGTILYTTTGATLYRVPAAGGAPSRVALADTSLRLVHPHLLPGGKAALVTVTPDYAKGRIGVLNLASGRVRQFGPGLAPRYLAGHLVYAGRTGELYRQAFDLERLEPSGPAEQIADGLDPWSGIGRVGFDAAPAGTLVYRVGSRWDRDRLRLTLTDREGRQQRAFPGRGTWAPRFSADGRRIAYGAFAPGRDGSDVWVSDLESGATQRLTTDGQDNNDAVWSPDGRSLAYSAGAPGGKDVFVRPLDGGPARLLVGRPGVQWSTDWAPDGSALLFTDTELTAGQEGDQDIWVQPTDGSPARPYAATPAHERAARFSPDGRWVAYESDETGRYEVYVQSYPTPGHKALVSAGGGVNPVWGGGGRELYYWQGDQMIVARLDAGGADAPLAVRGRAPLLRATYAQSVSPNYDASVDGSRFVIVTGGEHTFRLVVMLDALGARR